MSKFFKLIFIGDLIFLTMFDNTCAYFKKLLQPDSKDSIKSFAMMVSVFVGAFLALCLGISLLVDVCKDGVLDSDLFAASAFTVSIGAMVTLSGMPKMIVDQTKAKSQKLDEEEIG